MIGICGPQGQRRRVIGFRSHGINADLKGFPIGTGHPVWITFPDDLRAELRM